MQDALFTEEVACCSHAQSFHHGGLCEYPMCPCDHRKPAGLSPVISPADPYPIAPRGVRGDRESEGAANAAAPRVAKQRINVLRVLAEAKDGMTSDELERATGQPHQTASATLRHLVLLGYVSERGDTRPTQYGRAARVRRINSDGRKALEVADG